MRILISLSYYSPNISGLTNYAKILAEELSKNEHEVTVLTSQHDKKLLLQESINGVRIIRIPVTFRVGKGPIMLSFPFRILKYVVNADVVNCHLPQFESFILAFLARFNHKKLVLTYQTDLSWNGGILSKISNAFMLISHSISAILANKIVVLSEDYAMQSWFLRLFLKKLVYVYPPVKLIEPNKMTSKMFEKRMGLKRKYVIGMVARISREKGIEYLLEAIPFLEDRLKSDFIIVIAGPPRPIGEDNYAKKMEALFKKNNKFVKLIGKLEDEELTCFYKSLDALVLPSINSTEAFGMVQVEAMLCGVPVAASDLPGVRVPVNLTKMGKLAKIRDSIDLANNIVDVLRNKRKYVAEERLVKKIFSLEKTIDLYEETYSSY